MSRPCRACAGAPAFEAWCAACGGSGVVEERIPAADAVADAEALVMMAGATSITGETLTASAAVAEFWTRDEYRAGDDRFVRGDVMVAARAAFRAVPGLRA